MKKKGDTINATLLEITIRVGQVSWLEDMLDFLYENVKGSKSKVSNSCFITIPVLHL